jgi:hypothetical protein
MTDTADQRTIPQEATVARPHHVAEVAACTPF